MVRQVIASARVEQARLIAAAPRQYGPRPKDGVSGIAPSGGFVREGGGSASGDEDGGYRPPTPAGRVARNYAPGGTGVRRQGSRFRPSCRRRCTGGAAAGGRYAGSGGSGTGGRECRRRGQERICSGRRKWRWNCRRCAAERTQARAAAATPSFVAGGGSGGSASGNAAIGRWTGAWKRRRWRWRKRGYGYCGMAAVRALVPPEMPPARQTGNVLRGGSASGGGTPVSTSAAREMQPPTATNQYADAGDHRLPMTRRVKATAMAMPTPGAAGRGGNASAGGSGAGGTGQTNSSAGSSRPSVCRKGLPDACRQAQTPTGMNMVPPQARRYPNDPTATSSASRPRTRRRQRTTSSPPPGSRASAGRALRPGEWEPTPEPPPEAADGTRRRRTRSAASRKQSGRATRRGLGPARRRPRLGRRHPADSHRVLRRPAGGGFRPRPGRQQGDSARARTESSIDTLISAVWEHIEGWGIAGRGMYWRPVLQVHVAPDAEAAFHRTCRAARRQRPDGGEEMSVA